VEGRAFTPGVRPSIRRRKGISASPMEGTCLDMEHKRLMIAETVYFKVANRGFARASAEQDWLEAEAEIECLLGAPPTRKQNR
jgi:hypothetical protein